MDLNLYSKTGRKLKKKVKLDDSVFGAKVNPYLVSLAVRIYLGNQRKSTAHTKTRAEVRGGGKKPWAQKGTGRARHGSIRSPIWKGGGVTFGPRKERNYKRKLSKGMKKAAIRSAFSDFAGRKKIIIIEKIDLENKRMTKQVIKLTDKLTVEKKVLYIQKGKNRNLYLGSRNLKDIDTININEVNVYNLLNNDCLVIIEDVLEDISKFWGLGKASDKDKEDKKKIKRVSSRSSAKKSEKKKTERGKENKDIKELKLPARVENVLKKEGIKTRDELRSFINSGRKIRGIGEKSVEHIKKKIKI